MIDPIVETREVYRCPICKRSFTEMRDYADHVNRGKARKQSLPDDIIGKIVEHPSGHEFGLVEDIDPCMGTTYGRVVTIDNVYGNDPLTITHGVRSVDVFIGISQCRIHDDPAKARSSFVDEAEHEALRKFDVAQWQGYRPKTAPFSGEVDPEPIVDSRRVYVCPGCGDEFSTEDLCRTHIARCRIEMSQRVRALKDQTVTAFLGSDLFYGLVINVSCYSGEVEVRGSGIRKDSTSLRVTEVRRWVPFETVFQISEEDIQNSVSNLVRTYASQLFDRIIIGKGESQ